MAIVEPNPLNPNANPLVKNYCCYIEFPNSFHTDYNGWWGINPPEWDSTGNPKWPDMFPATYPTDIWKGPYVEPFKEDPEATKKWQEAIEQYKKQANFMTAYNGWTQNKGYYTTEFEIPGFKKEHVNIELKEKVLSIKISREDGKYLNKAKTLTLPSDADEATIVASVEDGVLLIGVTKVAPPAAKKIVVN